MTEKDFKVLLNNITYSNIEKENLLKIAEKIKFNIQEHLSKHLRLTNFELVGSIANNLLLKDMKKLDLAITLEAIDPLPNDILLKVSLNEMENCFLYTYDNSKLLMVERDQMNNIIHLSYEDSLYVNIYIRYLGLDNPLYLLEKETNKIKYIEETNDNYTLYKNTLLLVKYYEQAENIKNINSYLIAVLLAYGLTKYPPESKYYSYLGTLVKALDDFTNGLPINTDAKIPGYKYQVIDPVNENDNLANYINDINILDYRKLRKRLSKEIEKDDNLVNFKFDSSIEVVIDCNPKQLSQNNYAWNYVIIGKNLNSSGGNYTSDEKDYQTAILKGLFRGLKALVDNNLIKKKIILLCNYDDILGDHMLSTDENKSRMKTIKRLIDDNKLNVVFKKDNK